MSLVAFVLLVVLSVQQAVLLYGEPQLPCFFIFGDSLADSGNNNFLPTQAKANYPPYGIDFPYGPTGRFTNGRTAVDIIGEFLGFKNFIPSFLRAGTSDILQGVNYASGSAGILDETGQHLGFCFSMNEQLRNHKTIIARMVADFGDLEAASEHLRKCLYYVGIGNNDYINNYFLPQHFSTSRGFTPEQYAEVLIEEYYPQLKRLYSYGARKVAIEGVGRIGCTPNAIATYGTNGSSCVYSMNKAADIFNKNLKMLIDQLNKDFADARFILVNPWGNSTSTRFKVSNVGCCQVSANGECIAFKEPCQNRNDYLFWDSFHPSEATNKIAARRAYKTLDPLHAYPYDINHLVASQFIDM